MELSNHFAFELQLVWLRFLCCAGIVSTFKDFIKWQAVNTHKQIWQRMNGCVGGAKTNMTCLWDKWKKEQNPNIKLAGDGAGSLVKAYQITKGSQSSCQFPKAVKSDNTDYDSDESWRKKIKQDLGENALVFWQ